MKVSAQVYLYLIHNSFVSFKFAELLEIVVDPISEEKARRTLERLDLLNKVREETIFSSKIEERLKLCQTSAELPEWWLPGKHDKELLLGAAKYEISKL
jgi:chromodomain-helicase-DNA-binding protein 7